MQVTITDPQYVYDPVTFQVPYVDPSEQAVRNALKIMGIEKMFGCPVSEVDPKVTKDYLDTVEVLVDP